MGIAILALVAVSLYVLISRTSRATDTLYVKLGLALMLSPLVFYLFCLLLELSGAKGMIGGLSIAVGLAFVAFPVGLLLVTIHALLKVFARRGSP